METPFDLFLLERFRWCLCPIIDGDGPCVWSFHLTIWASEIHQKIYIRTRFESTFITYVCVSRPIISNYEYCACIPKLTLLIYFSDRIPCVGHYNCHRRYRNILHVRSKYLCFMTSVVITSPGGVDDAGSLEFDFFSVEFRNNARCGSAYLH